MQNNSFSWKKYNQNPIVGILRGLTTEEVLKIIPPYVSSGYYTIEITMNSPEVSQTIATLAKQYPELNVGAGTVCNMKDLTVALEAGAQFIVTPIIDEEVIKHCVAHDIPIFPGAYTPTEIYRAWSLGASAVKVFPATQLGTQYIKDVLAPLNEIKLLPTGGVSVENIKSFFEAGAVGAGLASSLFDKKMIREGNYADLEKHFLKMKNEIRDFIKE
ncbi:MULTISPECIES: bifunctional 4-hydroxy-2-oxoglutarate aldolase/2-dehydro-3-deoxy-phosphogluconate aldolase [Zobellia]|uniref:2-Dehydro-3-deoxy-6-phosphogalactonate aldolase n=1 Tax=Zobellia galactanivorans (strain DSM 12802 / CCUG 47099 / CIP 106680 / NCIMB 13871 / Dsij) TaxID=63186 RepID=G0L7B7_ZOBGA|nr:MULTISPECIES: bifunctional 4-hydroxy-2-oxoglutarate aldolase/2-dehydro-3-deoxy-phosphogluconate aldolase [Zobellia]MBU3025326.1 bifunctional 4-hydroxy-2-oxoglutarate aldolase/2-dehydro-3-deoxy-phosphogluconate aldolase [Zobellia galactanivorans]OWW23596.1 2-dehydro-3-deoxyphosphogluconate aldolase [Zobellia sp. OII3]CAZ97292.1 2-Dehydro-3-deoxy-6-phosphogalactonate aldolase [Zobellia galactanivorans]